MYISKTKSRPVKKIHCSSAEATIWIACAFLPCLQREAAFWNPLPQTGQPMVSSKCFFMWVNIQSWLVWKKVHSWHWYSLPPSGWFSHLGWASGGTASLGTITVGRVVDLSEGPGWGGLLGMEVTSGWGISVVEIWWCFGGISWISWEAGVITSLLLEATAGIEELVMPTIGIVEGGGTIGVMVYAWGGWISCCCKVDAGCIILVASTLRNWATGNPRSATSNCCIVSAWSNSTILLIWLANQIYCKAWKKKGWGVELKSMKN